FGTGIWRYFATAALAALQGISDALVGRDAAVLVSLGGSDTAAAARSELTRANVRVVDYVDQWAALGEADLFITHPGTHPTHPAPAPAFPEFPRTTHPFSGAHPPPAGPARGPGRAGALPAEPQAPVTTDALVSVLRRLAEGRDRFAARLAEARSWELRTIAGR